MSAPLADREKALARMNGNEEVYDEILDLLVDTLPAKLAELQTAQQQSDMPTIERLAHSVKGGSASVGATPISMAALALEECARSQSGAEVPGLLGALLDEFERLRGLVRPG